MFNAFISGMMRGMVGGSGYQYDSENSVTQTTNKIALRALPGENEFTPDMSRDNRMDRPSMREAERENPTRGNPDRDNPIYWPNRDSEKPTNWEVIVKETGQGVLNTAGAISSAESGNFTQGAIQAGLAADNFYQAGKEIAPVVGNVCEFLGNEINKDDVYWDSMERK